MKKVYENWPELFSKETIDPKWWDKFEANAKAASAEIHRVKDYDAAKKEIATILKEFSPKSLIAVGGEGNPKLAEIYAGLNTAEHPIYTDKYEIAEHAPTADVGFSCAEFGVGETGSVCVDTCSYESRVVGMLPPVHIVFLNSKYITENVSTAFKIIAKGFKKGHMGFITGPSRTADIERVLTLGVHGPSRFFIIAIDEA